MKHKFILIIFFFFNFASINAQDTCENNFLKLKNIIQKSIPVDEDQYSNNLSEYFIIDIKLNEKQDSIYNIDFYKKNNSTHFMLIERLIQKISLEWSPVKCKYNRLIIPIFILFSSSEELFDYPFGLINNKICSSKKYKSGTYFFKEIIIQVHARTK